MIIVDEIYDLLDHVGAAQIQHGRHDVDYQGGQIFDYKLNKSVCFQKDSVRLITYICKQGW